MLTKPFHLHTGACSVAASYKPPMLVTRVRLPACAFSNIALLKCACCVACMRKAKSQANRLLGGFSLDYCYTQQNFQATSRVSIPHHTTSNTESKPWRADSSIEILPAHLLCQTLGATNGSQFHVAFQAISSKVTGGMPRRNMIKSLLPETALSHVTLAK